MINLIHLVIGLILVGYGEDVDWKAGWTNAEQLAQQMNKPIFLLIHKTWCGACRQLKNAFTDRTNPTYQEFVQESKHFVMVNVEDNEEPEGDRFHPDGIYFPRILFYGTTTTSTFTCLLLQIRTVRSYLEL